MSFAVPCWFGFECGQQRSGHDAFVRPLEAVVRCPFRVCGFGALVDFLICVLEDDEDCPLGMLLFNEDQLLSFARALCIGLVMPKAPFAFDDDEPVFVDPIWNVVRDTRRHGVGDAYFLVRQLHTVLFELCCYLSFEAGSVLALEENAHKLSKLSSPPSPPSETKPSVSSNGEVSPS